MPFPCLITFADASSVTLSTEFALKGRTGRLTRQLYPDADPRLQALTPLWLQRARKFNARLVFRQRFCLTTGLTLQESGVAVCSLVNALGRIAVVSVMRNVCFHVAFYFTVEFAAVYSPAYDVVEGEALWFRGALTFLHCELTLMCCAVSLPCGNHDVFVRALGCSSVDSMTLLSSGVGLTRSSIAGGRITILDGVGWWAAVI
ncbi:hypothetical protein CH63R_10449 [Colletotrichum higginsianum IMI 349063]|uniref:Uncharacterized protein n=1 Tax=Colletotrichum higginsianum (strain IMI 349063) TaxID=759273 RepID=A0A1B7Y2U8_COLHI|nr:uncharacterized protein CH63R_10449 [Colletotrichum higginsianum IMI 349063]OBR06329.1 hypothetical protein CH63R_10449 [Colletotrichum higginsianum IMI 349063]